MAAGERRRWRDARAGASGTPPAYRLVAAAGRIAAGRTTVAVAYRAGVADGAVARGTLVDPRVVLVTDLPAALADGDLVVVLARRSANGSYAADSERFLVDHVGRVPGENGATAGYLLFLNAPSSLPVSEHVVPPASPPTDEPEPDERTSDALIERHRSQWEDLPPDLIPDLEFGVWRTIARALGFG